MEKSSFSLLVRLPAFIKMRRLLVSRIRAHIVHLLASSPKRHVFQFCFLVDNSGSMGGDIARQVRTALVLAMETLKRLECEFRWAEPACELVAPHGGAVCTVQLFVCNARSLRGSRVASTHASPTRVFASAACLPVFPVAAALCALAKRPLSSRRCTSL